MSAWCDTYDDVERVLKKKKIKNFITYMGGFKFKNRERFIGATSVIRRGNSVPIIFTYDIVQSDCFFVVVKTKMFDIEPLVFLLKTSVIENRRSICIHMSEIYKYSLDMFETLMPNSIAAISGKSELVSVDSLV